MDESRAYTAEEARKIFLDQIRGIVRYWATLPEADKATGDKITTMGRCDGVAFSILNIFDGATMGMPALDISLSPHPDDKQFHIDEGSNWFEPGMVINDTMLHEEWSRLDKSDAETPAAE